MSKLSPRSPHISGLAAYFEPIPGARFARERALAAARQARDLIRNEAPDAEEKSRIAIDHLVEAFLVDRIQNQDCFARSHALGRRVNRRFGCPVPYESELDGYLNKCPILALHSRFGLSPGGTTTGHCSICEAPDFECDHIPGRRYDGEPCFRWITNWDVEEVSVVRRPKDPRCYKLFVSETRQEAEARLGTTLLRGESLPCDHCLVCNGQFGPTDEDLDPNTWPEIPAEQDD